MADAFGNYNFFFRTKQSEVMIINELSNFKWIVCPRRRSFSASLYFSRSLIQNGSLEYNSIPFPFTQSRASPPPYNYS